MHVPQCITCRSRESGYLNSEKESLKARLVRKPPPSPTSSPQSNGEEKRKDNKCELESPNMLGTHLLTNLQLTTSRPNDSTGRSTCAK
jgi:hypothetical protein